MQKKKIIFVIVFILLTMLSLFINEVYIINSIENKLIENLNSRNYYMKINYHQGVINDNTYTEYLICNDYKMINNESDTIIEYSLDEIYFINKEEKVYVKADEDITAFDDDNFYNISNYYFKHITDNERSLLGQILIALKAKIIEIEYDGTECYSIDYKDITVYVDKKSLLLISKIDYNYGTGEDYEIKVNSIDSNDFSKEALLKDYKNITEN